MLLNLLASMGQRGLKFSASFGRAGLMLFNAIIGKPEFRKHGPLLVRQLYNVGVLSMIIIIVSGLFIGMVLGLQGYLVLTTYSAETSLGMLVALSLLRELGPVVAALLFAGRAGSALTAARDFAALLGGRYLAAAADGNFRGGGRLGRFSRRRKLERH